MAIAYSGYLIPKHKDLEQDYILVLLYIESQASGLS